MAEEKLTQSIDRSTPTSDDLSVLRILLHNVKGISSVSAVNTTVYDDSLA